MDSQAYDVAWRFVQTIVCTLNYEQFCSLLDVEKFKCITMVNDAQFVFDYSQFISTIKIASFDNIEATSNFRYAISPSVDPDFSVTVHLSCWQSRRGFGIGETGPGIYEIMSTMHLKMQHGLVVSMFQPEYTKVKLAILDV